GDAAWALDVSSRQAPGYWGDNARAGRGSDLRLEPARDRREERVVLGARCHDAAALAAAQVHVDLPRAERVGMRPAPVDAGEEVLLLRAGCERPLRQVAVVA